MAKKTARQIIKEQMPKFRVVKKGAAADAAARAKPDAVSPDLAALRRKYLGESPDHASASDAEAAPDDDGEILVVEHKAAEGRRRGAGPKGVVVSKGKISGVQG